MSSVEEVSSTRRLPHRVGWGRKRLSMTMSKDVWRDPRLPPSLKQPPVVQIARWLRDPIGLLDECRAKFGDAFTFRFPQTPPIAILSDPDAVKTIFTGDPEQLRAGEANVVLEPLMGTDSLLLLDGQRHLRERRLMMPPFHGERMQAYGRTMRDVTRSSLARWPRGAPIRFHDRAQSITLDVILRTVFGASERATELRGALSTLISISSSPILLLPVFQVAMGVLTPWARIVRQLEEVDRLILAQIEARRAAAARGEHGDDVLGMLLAARHEDGSPMSAKELRDEMVTLLVAGHETTATSLAWMFHWLSILPDVQARARDEVRRVAGPDGLVAPERVAELTYLDGVVKETLRLNPVVPLVARVLHEDTSIGGRVLPRGAVAAPSIFVTHRRKDHWPDPERFDPMRFVDKKVSPYAFFPFGGGTRRCLGMAFALYEMKMVAATILASLEVLPAPGYTMRLVRRSITFAPSDGAPLVFR